MARVFITSEKKCMATQVLPITSNTTSGEQKSIYPQTTKTNPFLYTDKSRQKVTTINYHEIKFQIT